MYVIVKLAKQQRDMSQCGIYEDYCQLKGLKNSSILKTSVCFSGINGLTLTPSLFLGLFFV